MSAKSEKVARRRVDNRNLVGFFILAVGLLGAALVVRHDAAKPKVVTHTEIVPQFDLVSIPVPIEPVPAGTRLKDIKLKMQPFPSHQLPPGALKELGGYLEMVSVAALPANLPIYANNFSLNASSNPVIDRIPEGMRAITVKVDATSAVEGWAGSGTVIDVLLVEKDKTSVIAEKVKILSAERSVAPVEGQASPSVPSTVTLLVTQAQCLAINTAIPLGRIAFALRSANDETTWTAKSFTSENLKGANTRSKPSSISGFVSVKGIDHDKAFAFSDGKWVRTEVVPEGFLVNSSN